MTAYSQSDVASLQTHYNGLRDKASYDAFVQYCHDLLIRIGADPYHVRMALTKGYSMMEFGSRAAIQHIEKTEGIEIGLLIRAADIGQVEQQHRRYEQSFKPTGDMMFIHPIASDWNSFPQELLALNEIAMREEYERIKDTRLVEIRKDSGTTNEALKHCIVNGISVMGMEGSMGLIMMNLTWSSNDWKGPSDDPSNHRWVKEGNVPSESWNFDFDNVRNTPDHVYGYAQHVAPPKLSGKNNLVIFHSDGKVVGFYGKAELIKEKVPINEGQYYNIIGDRALSMVLGNKLEGIKAKGYIEDKQRMGQNGFIYLKEPGTVLKMIDEAMSLNTDQRIQLTALRQWVSGKGNERTTKTNTQEHMSIPLNRIFYGPPGTGKTYHTVGAALAVCDPAFYAANKSNDEALRKRFNELLIRDWDTADGSIGFCTFHQSFSYEDFVEGIKPLVPDEGDKFVKYAIREGILKLMARRAGGKSNAETAKAQESFSFTPQEFERAEFYKLSLGAVYNKEDEDIYSACIRNNVIAVGYLGQHDLTKRTEHEINELPLQQDQTSSSASQANYFRHYLKKGDYVIVTRGNLSVRAIGKVTGDYRYAPDLGLPYPHVRDVQWLLKDQDIPWEEVYSKKFVQRTIYKLIKEEIKRDFFVKANAVAPQAEEAKNFVLIIDEINRGNVAGIFGELITLIEENKRKGKPEALEVTLPYSQESFSIPDNLYIIGTMNTADRSVEALDAALRRRFSFVPMMPTADNLKKLQNPRIDITAMLKKINDRMVQFLDEDHQIGHSHFWELHKESDPLPELRRVFADKIIPQLEEYFHRDRARLRLVLGDAFVEKVEADEKLFNGDSDDIDFELRPTFRLRPREQWNEAAFVAIYG